MRHGREEIVLHLVRLAQRGGVLGLADEPGALDAQRRVVRERGEKALLRRIEDDRAIIAEDEHADDTRLHA